MLAGPPGDYPPVKDFLGRETLEILAAPDRVESCIIEVCSQPSGVGFASCTVLAQGPLLTEEQVARLRSYILTPEAHYNGQPVFRRRPSIPISHFASGAEIVFLTCWLTCTIRAGSFIVVKSITAIGTGSATSWSAWRRSYSLGLRRRAHEPSGSRVRSRRSKKRRGPSARNRRA